MSRKLKPQDRIVINGQEILVKDFLKELKRWMDTNFVCTVGTVNMINNIDFTELMEFPRMDLEDCKANGFNAKDVLLYNAFAMGFNAGVQTERKEMMGTYLAQK